MATGQWNLTQSPYEKFPSNSPFHENEKQTLPSDTHSQASSRINKAKAPLRSKTPPKKAFTELYVWGNDQFGQLGLGHKYLKQQSRDLESVHQPELRKILLNPKSCSFSIQIKEVACGEDFAFLLTRKGLLYAMGSNQFGKLGIWSQQNLTSGQAGHFNANNDAQPSNSNLQQQNKRNRSRSPASVDEIPFASTPKLVECLAKYPIAKVTCGLNHAVAVTADKGFCYSWGCGSHGQLGRVANNSLNLNPPSIVSYFVTRSIKIVDVAAGGKHTLFMSDQSQVYGVGMNDFGQLGRGDYMPRQQKNVEPSEVVKLRGTPIQIACGLVHSQVLLANGKVVSFGDNQFGQLGLGSGVNEHSTGMPTEIPSLENIKAIACNHHSAAIGARGELYFWGTGVFGTFFEPKIVIDAGITEVSVGGSFGIAKDIDGLLWSWGQNSNGELGLSDTKIRLAPQPILTLKRKHITKAVCGGSFAVAIGPDKNPASASPAKKRSARKVASPQQQMTTPPPIIFNNQKESSVNVPIPMQSIMSNDLEHVKIFSAREGSSVETVSNKLLGNADVQSYFNNNNNQSSSAHFGSLHSQSQIFVKESKHITGTSNSVKKSRASQSRSQSRSNQIVKKLAKGDVRRSVSPILASHQSQQSFISGNKPIGGGAVQAPRKRKTTASKSRSKSKTTTRNGASSTFIPVRSKQPMSATLTVNNEKPRNTFQLAYSSKDHHDSVGDLQPANPFGSTNHNGSQVSVDYVEHHKATPSMKTSNSAQFGQEQLHQSEARVAALETQLMAMQQENSRMASVMKQQKESMQEMRQQVVNCQPAKVINEFTDEVQKAHDLEYLLRCKERTIEILRGDLDDSRNQRKQVDQDMQRVLAQNQQMLSQNESLQDENSRLKEALEHAINTCSQLKSQRNQYSDRFGVLSNEMNTLRELANDIRTHQGTKSDYNSQNVTKARTSLDQNHDTIIIQPPSTKTAQPAKLQSTTQDYLQMPPNIRLVNVVTDKREAYFQSQKQYDDSHRQQSQPSTKQSKKHPETTKNQNSKLNLQSMKIPDQSFSPSEIVLSDDRQNATSKMQTPLSKMNNEEPQIQGASQFTIRDLVVDQQEDQETLVQQETFNKNPDQNHATLNNCDVTTNNDNKEHSTDNSMVRKSRKTISRNKKTSVSGTRAVAKRASSKENNKSESHCSRVCLHKSQNFNTASKAARPVSGGKQRPGSLNISKKVRSTSVGKQTKQQQRVMSTSQTMGTNQSILVSNLKSPVNQPLTLQKILKADSSVKQINLTVQSINKLAEIVQQEHQQLMQQSISYGFDPSQSALYTCNQNQGDHSVLLRSPPAQLNKVNPIVLDQQMQHSSPQQQPFLANSSHYNNPMLTLSGHDIQGNQTDSHMDSVITQNPHQQQQEQMSVESLDGKRNNNYYVATAATQIAHGAPAINPMFLCESQYSQQQPHHPPQHQSHLNESAYEGSSMAASNPFRQVTNNVSLSVARMQREGLGLNRKPELAAALRDSNRAANSAQKDPRNGSGSVFDRVQEASSRKHSPLDISSGPFRKSHLVNRSASLGGGLYANDSSGVARKKETIDNFKNKLNRLEQNKMELENKMKLFDAKVNAHTRRKSAENQLETL